MFDDNDNIYWPLAVKKLEKKLEESEKAIMDLICCGNCANSLQSVIDGTTRCNIPGNNGHDLIVPWGICLQWEKRKMETRITFGSDKSTEAGKDTQ